MDTTTSHAHEVGIDAAEREIARRAAAGEDMTRAFVAMDYSVAFYDDAIRLAFLRDRAVSYFDAKRALLSSLLDAGMSAALAFDYLAAWSRA